MKKLWMWAVGVPFLVIGMVAVTFGGGGGTAVAGTPVVRTH